MKRIQSIEQFNETIGKDDKTVMIYTAGWCPDCRRLEMFIDDIIEEHQNINWFEVDKDEFSDLAAKNEVMGIPSLLVYEKGEKKAHLHSANAKSPEQVREFLQSV